MINMYKPKNIMIVEDEVLTQRYLKDIVTKNGMDVVGCFNNGTDTNAALKHTKCDIILVDINIKGSMDGLRLARRILESHTVCIIFITAYGDSETLEEALELSPYGFIVKPFTPEDIEVAISIAYKRFLLYETTRVEDKSEVVDIIILSTNLTYSMVHTSLLDNGKEISLTMKQTKFIALLARNLNHVVSNEAIIAEVWGDKIVKETSLRTLIYNIRKLVPSLNLISYSKVGYMIKSHIVK